MSRRPIISPASPSVPKVVAGLATPWDLRYALLPVVCSWRVCRERFCIRFR